MHTETEQNNETSALDVGHISVFGTYTQLSVPSSETKYNQRTTEVKQDIRATAQILSLLLASSRIESKFIKQK
jgi:hypothetical protein